MIPCIYPGCDIEWFHYSCMGLTKDLIPDGNWFCPECQTLRIYSNSKRLKMQHMSFVLVLLYIILM